MGIPKKSTKTEPWHYQFPEPKSRFVRDDAHTKTAISFFEHYHKCSQLPIAELLELHVYRNWPIIDMRKPDPLNKLKPISIEVIDGPMQFSDPNDYQEWAREKWGCGDYKFLLLEKGASDAMMTCRSMSNRNDMDRYPPKLDPATLVEGHRENEGYFKWCKLNGVVLPWEKPEEDEDDMAGTGGIVMEALRTSNDTLVNMAEERVKDAQRQAEIAAELAETRAEQQAQRGPSLEQQAGAEAIKMVSQTATEVIKMATANSGKQYDAVEIIKATAEMMRPRDGDGMGGGGFMNSVLQIIEKTNERQISMISQQNEFMTKVLEKLNNHNAPPIQKSTIDILEEQRRIGELMGWGPPNRGANVQQVAPPPPAEEKEGWLNERSLPLVMAGFQTIMILGANIVHNIVVAKLQPAGVEAQSPKDALAQAAQAGQQQQATTAAAPDPATQKAEEDRQGWIQFVESIEEPFLEIFFRKDSRGYHLAEYVIGDGGPGPTEQGLITYRSIRDRLGEKNFDVLARGNDEIWSRVQGMQAKYKAFVHEFFTYEEFAREQHAKAQQATATTAGAPAATTTPTEPAVS